MSFHLIPVSSGKALSKQRPLGTRTRSVSRFGWFQKAAASRANRQQVSGRSVAHLASRPDVSNPSEASVSGRFARAVQRSVSNLGVSNLGVSNLRSTTSGLRERAFDLTSGVASQSASTMTSSVSSLCNAGGSAAAGMSHFVKTIAAGIFGVCLGIFAVVAFLGGLLSRLITGSEEVELPNARLRLRFLGTLGTLAACAVVTRVYCLQGPEVERWRQIAARQHESSLTVYGARGTIFDREGRTLATSVRTLSVGVHPREIPKADMDRYVSTLSPILSESPVELRAKLETNKPFLWLERGLPLDTEERLKPAAVNALVYIPEFQRSYPQGQTASSVLGRVGRDGKGLAGIEQSYDELLRAPTIHLPVRRDARGRLVQLVDYTSDPMSDLGHIWDKLSHRVFGLPNEAPLLRVSEAHALVPEDDTDSSIRQEGHAVSLTIDSFLQDILEQELRLGQVDAKAKKTFGILLDAVNGEVLALAQSPGFDPNVEKTTSAEDLRNSVVQDSFEPGSTIKPLVLAAALDEHVIQSNTTMDCEGGSYVVGPHVIRDVHPQDVLSMRDVLVRSSNICMAKIGQKLGRERLGTTLQSMGFGRPARVELPGEARGIFREPTSWAEIDVATHAFGQGLSVTAMQMVQAYSALANDGLMVHPHIIRAEGVPVEHTRVLTSAAAAAVGDMLRGVVEDEHGTGQKAAVRGMIVRGKTGTAQKANPDGRGYDPDNVFASFVGYLRGDGGPLQHKLVLFIGVDEPGVQPRWGGVVAAPIFQRTMERVVAHLLAKEGDDRPDSMRVASNTDLGSGRRTLD